MDLKLAKLPERTPVKLLINLPPSLHDALGEYAALYAETYGQTEAVADLVPYMLRCFLDGDRAFARRQAKSGAPGERK